MQAWAVLNPLANVNPGVAGALIWSGVAVVSTHHGEFSEHQELLHNINRTDSGCPRPSQKYVIKKKHQVNIAWGHD